MHIITKIALGTLIPRLINETYTYIINNRKFLLKKHVNNIKSKLNNKNHLEIVLYRVSKSEYVRINKVLFNIINVINTEEEKKLYLVEEGSLIHAKIMYNLMNPDDLNTIANAIFYKLSKV